jgi:hypothetical protein
LAIAAIQKRAFFSSQKEYDQLCEKLPVKWRPFGGATQSVAEIETPKPIMKQKDPESRKRKSPRTRAERSKVSKN